MMEGTVNDSAHFQSTHTEKTWFQNDLQLWDCHYWKLAALSEPLSSSAS
jgi:hypothetical protein